MKVPFQIVSKLPTQMPAYGSQGAAAIDLQANMTEAVIIAPGTFAVFDTGIAFAIPDGYAGFVVPRSGLGFKHGIVLRNGTGVIDSDYRGEVKVALLNTGDAPYEVQPLERIAQMLFMPVVQVQLTEVPTLDKTMRGNKGFGSTGKV